MSNTRHGGERDGVSQDRRQSTHRNLAVLPFGVLARLCAWAAFVVVSCWDKAVKIVPFIVFWMVKAFLGVHSGRK